MKLVSVFLVGLMSWSASLMSAAETNEHPLYREWDVKRTANSNCANPKNWKPSQEQLTRILADHRTWIAAPTRDMSDQRRARLCNADLPGSAIADANRELNLGGGCFEYG